MGDTEWEAPETLHFAFRGLTVRLGAVQLQQKEWQPAAEARKSYRFRHVGAGIAALASSAGGFILMSKETSISAGASADDAHQSAPA